MEILLDGVALGGYSVEYYAVRGGGLGRDEVRAILTRRLVV